jgi:hypothetical protein
MVFKMCGVTDVVTRTNIINQEGFTTIEDLGVLKNDSDVSDMAKRMASRMLVEGRVQLGTVGIKRVQTLVWWVRDHQKRGLAIDAALFSVEKLELSHKQNNEIPQRYVFTDSLFKYNCIRHPRNKRN